MMVLAQPIGAREEILPAEPSNTIPLIQAFERRHEKNHSDLQNLKDHRVATEMTRQQLAEARATAQAEAEALLRAESLQQAYARSLHKLQSILEHPDKHRFEDWDSANDNAISITRQLITDCGLLEYEMILLRLREDAALFYLMRLDTMSHGAQPRLYSASPGDGTKIAENMIPSAQERLNNLVDMGGTEYQPLVTQMKILGTLRGKLTRRKVAKTIRAVWQSVEELIQSVSVTRSGNRRELYSVLYPHPRIVVAQ
jgi:hypothetical protein